MLRISKAPASCAHDHHGTALTAAKSFTPTGRAFALAGVRVDPHSPPDPSPACRSIAGRAYQLTTHDSDLGAHAGQVMNLTGDLNGDTINVSKVVMP